mgnify:CR=1 FL=1
MSGVVKIENVLQKAALWSNQLRHEISVVGKPCNVPEFPVPC